MINPPFEDRLPQRFWDKVDEDESGCWLWVAAHDQYGYGLFRWEGKMQRAHRVSLTVLEGPGEGDALHSCDRPACVRPSHLRWGSHFDNMQDRAARGRAWRQGTETCPRGHRYDEHASSNTRQGRKCKVCNADRMRKVR